MEIKYKVLISNDFIVSFRKLMDIQGLKPEQKFELVKMRKTFINAIEALKETVKDYDQKEVEEFLERSIDFAIKKVSLPEECINGLTATDIFNLEPLIKEN